MRAVSAPRSSRLLLLGAALFAVAAIAACSTAVTDEGVGQTSSATGTGCGVAGNACCAEGTRCKGELGCSAGVCKSVVSDMVAYTEYCKEELGFRNPKAKLPFMSCFDAAKADGTRESTGRQAQLALSLREGEAVQVFELGTNGPVVKDGKDVWDLMFGRAGAGALGCDTPNYLQGRCDPYYRLNVFAPDPGNADVVAALHCRSDGEKPTPATAISAEARRVALDAAPASMSVAEKTRLFDQWNASNEIVLTMTNTRTGKACFFHAATPYYGSHLPAPDNETNLAAPGAADLVWDELPVKPAYGKDDAARRPEWLRNGANAWQRPDFMRCTGCHDSGPFMHNPFIDSMDSNLPNDRKTRPYFPLGYQAQTPAMVIKTGPVRNASGGTSAQRCTSCHSMGFEKACGDWFDRALGWSFPSSASAESQRAEGLKRYMPLDHGASTSAEFYAESGASVDVMKCCCEHPSWRGCKTVPAATPQAEGREGTAAESCTESTCGGYTQDCCAGSACNHSGLACVAGKCRFKDE